MTGRADGRIEVQVPAAPDPEMVAQVLQERALLEIVDLQGRFYGR